MRIGRATATAVPGSSYPSCPPLISPPIKAVICDVYHTLLGVEPVPRDEAGPLWRGFTAATHPGRSFPSLEEIDRLTMAETGRRHAVRHAHGEPFPEIDWPDVLASVFGEAATGWTAEQKGAVADFHARLMRRTMLMPGAADFLTWASRAGILLGLASNAQAYTRRELADALAGAGLSDALFDPDLTFLSYEHGFSKPSPAVFLQLSDRLVARGIAPHEILMIGDRPDNDIAPAQAAGWRTWRLDHAARSPHTKSAGPWDDLGQWLFL